MEELKLNIIKKSNTYNIIIPPEVERKIRYTCQKVWNTEWSGTLFYTYEGTFEKGDLTIKCEDFYVMDIGSQAYTEFNMNPDIIAYMAEHSELLDCQMGLIHSHNNMSTFFSGTDIDTLKEEGKDRNNFVSLIVNNAGTYTAAITRKVDTKVITAESFYNFFGEGVKQSTEKYEVSGDIEYYYLNIIKEENNYDFPEIGNRLEELKALKEKNRAVPQEIKIPANMTFDFNTKKDSDLDFYNEVKIDDATVRQLVCQIITGSILVNTDSKINIEKCVNAMPVAYQKAFGDGDQGMESFDTWADVYIEYLIWNKVDTYPYIKSVAVDDTEMGAILAQALIEELSKFTQNKYIEGYIKVLQRYLI